MVLKLPSAKTQKEWSYNEWLEFFRTVKAEDLIENEDKLKQKLTVEAFAAARRWIEIAANPSKMDKILQGRLDSKTRDDIMDVAVGDDDEAFYEKLIQENVAQLNSTGTSPQEVARLSQNINIFRRELREIRSRKPKKGTTLNKVLSILEEQKEKAEKQGANQDKKQQKRNG